MGLFDGSTSGYNCEEVNALRNVINDTAQQAGEKILEELHDGVVVEMARAWYAPEAVEFFNGFAETVKASGEAITNAFDAYRGAIQEMGTRWAENTKGEAPNLPAIDQVELNLNVSDVQSDDNGNIYIKENLATNIANNLPNVEEWIKNDLEKLANKLDAKSAFIGHGQADAARDCFTVVSGEIHRIFKYLTEGETNLQGEIKKAVRKYQQVSESVTNDFNSVSNQ